MRLPIRSRLVAGFAAAMLLLLTGAGAFVWWRVQVALDRDLDDDLHEQLLVLQTQGRDRLPEDVLSDVRAVGTTDPLVPQAVVDGTAHTSGGDLLTSGRHRLRYAAVERKGQVYRVAVRQSSRDEALRELLLQLVVGLGSALAGASFIGYRLAAAALEPVDAYRARAQEITDGHDTAELDVPSGADDEVTRLGHTLNAMLRAQRQAAVAQRQFLADASHELRGPLTVLSTEVELALRRPRTPEELEATLRQVAEDTARLRRLADALLDLERAGRDVAGRSSVDGVEVALDPDVLDQVLRNLVTNAQVHGAEPVTVTATSSGGWVLVAVHDEGDGIEPAFLPESVERFRRADSARTTEGLGLGLALVHEIARAAGGELRTCSRGAHHRHPPLVADVPCRHAATGTTVTLVLRVV